MKPPENMIVKPNKRCNLLDETWFDAKSTDGGDVIFNKYYSIRESLYFLREYTEYHFDI